jgi:hypothetical protein
MVWPRPSWPASDPGVHVRSASDRGSWRMRPSRPAHVPPPLFPFFLFSFFLLVVCLDGATK